MKLALPVTAYTNYSSLIKHGAINRVNISSLGYLVPKTAMRYTYVNDAHTHVHIHVILDAHTQLHVRVPRRMSSKAAVSDGLK